MVHRSVARADSALPIYPAMAVLMIREPDGEHLPLLVRGRRGGPLAILTDEPSAADMYPAPGAPENAGRNA